MLMMKSMARKQISGDWGGSNIMSMLCNRNRMIKRFQNGGAAESESGTNGTVEKLDCVCK